MKFSTFNEKNRVVFPAWAGERIYMEEFTKEQGLPPKLQRWQSTVDQMLENIDNTDKIYLMVDQAFVKAGNTHRRGGLHVDGFWNAGQPGLRGVSCHGPQRRGGHESRPSHMPQLPPRWKPERGGHMGLSNGGELIMLASDVQACRGVIGKYEEVVWKGGDYSHLHPEDFENHLLEPNRVYVGDTGSFLHESIAVKQDCYRTVVRLNVRTH